MKPIRNFFKESCEGAVMLEALIVYPVTLFLLFFVLSIFSVLYQDWNVQTIANETAARIAQTYKYAGADAVTGYVDVSEIKKTNPYRYAPSLLAGQKKDAEVLVKAKNYAKARLSRTTFTQSVSEPIVDVSIESAMVSRKYMVVTIESSYKVPFGEALDYFGLKGTVTYAATGYAECLDLSDYVTMSDFIESYSSLGFLDSSALDAIESIMKFFDSVAEE